MNRKETFSANGKMANKMYEPGDEKVKDELNQGLAETHEQVSDVYAEGTVDATIENVQGTGETVRIPEGQYK